MILPKKVYKVSQKRRQIYTYCILQKAKSASCDQYTSVRYTQFECGLRLPSAFGATSGRLSHAVRVWPSALYLTREGSCHTNICKLGSIHFGSIRRGSSVASASLAPSSPLRNDCRTRFKCDIWLPGAFSSTSGRLSHAVRVALSFFLGGFVPFYGKQVDLGRICPFLLGTD